MTWPAVKQAFTQEQFGVYVKGLNWSGWRPSLIVWHNTAAPSLAQWEKTAQSDEAKGLIPGTTRINNLENYFRYDREWSGAPHAFIAPRFIWAFNPFTSSGVHSPSWNNISIGLEMVGDFSQEDDDSGDGLLVKNNTIYVTAMLCAALGLDPKTAIRLHKQDPRTTHDCPGMDIAQDKDEMIASVEALMCGGEHDPSIDIETPPLPKPVRRGVVTVDDLNFRRGPGVMNESTGSLPKGTKVVILNEAKNGSTVWYQVKTPAGYTGWSAGKYITVT